MRLARMERMMMAMMMREKNRRKGGNICIDLQLI
jgi:hypothetical protein